VEYYQPFLNLFKKSGFNLPNLLGNAPQKRDEIASSMIKIFDSIHLSFGFISSLFLSELRIAESHTLFRGNSMASKAMDMFMKINGKG
jgi:hypothetical protein